MNQPNFSEYVPGPGGVFQEFLAEALYHLLTNDQPVAYEDLNLFEKELYLRAARAAYWRVVREREASGLFLRSLAESLEENLRATAMRVPCVKERIMNAGDCLHCRLVSLADSLHAGLTIAEDGMAMGIWAASARSLLEQVLTAKRLTKEMRGAIAAFLAEDEAFDADAVKTLKELSTQREGLRQKEQRLKSFLESAAKVLQEHGSTELQAQMKELLMKDP